MNPEQSFTDIRRELPPWLEEGLNGCGVMGVFRGASPIATAELAERAWDLGAWHVEIPIEAPSSVLSLRAAVEAGERRGRRVGAGTIIGARQLEIAIDEGAAYGVSPGFDAELIELADSAGFPFLPGVSTPSEILAARKMGFLWLKAFPASVLGSSWLSAMKGPYPDVRFVATGGMDATNAAEFLGAGASVVGIGSAFGDPAQEARLRALIARTSIAEQLQP